MESKEVIERLKEFANHFATNGYPYNAYSSSSSQIKSELNIIEKDLEMFEQYKQIEEKIGIDLITLFKTETVFWKDESGIHKSCECYIDLHFHELVVYEYPEDRYDSSGYRLAFEEYGKTWALTREELEK